MESKRIQWLDIAKGITILLMVLGHTSIPKMVSNFIFAFHMPLFFVASGWCTNWIKDSFLRFVGRKTRDLGIPFIIYSIIVIFLFYLIGSEEFRWERVIFEGWRGYALWFVPVLFFSLILSKAIMSFIPLKWVRYSVCIFFLILGVSLRHYRINLPWTLSTVPYATCLLLLGSSLKFFQDYINKPRLWILVLSFSLTFIISLKWRMDLAWNNIIPVFLLSLGAISGITMMFSFSSILTRIPWVAKFLQAIGKETFVIMAFSQVLCLTISHYYPCNKLLEYSLMFLLLFLIVLLKNGFNKIIGSRVL